jgi:hypothetical protein
VFQCEGEIDRMVQAEARICIQGAGPFGGRSPACATAGFFVFLDLLPSVPSTLSTAGLKELDLDDLMRLGC